MIPILILCPWLVLVLQAQFASLPTWGSQRMGRARRVLRASGKYGNSSPGAPACNLYSAFPVQRREWGGACRSRSPCSSLLSAQPPCQTSGARSPHPSSTPPTVPVGPTGCRRRICDYPAPRPVECCVVGAGRDQRPTGCCKQGVDETKKNDIQGSLQFRMEWGHFCRLWRQIIELV